MHQGSDDMAESTRDVAAEQADLDRAVNGLTIPRVFCNTAER
jgi:hypothetical protein